jgi:hypothetical protein
MTGTSEGDLLEGEIVVEQEAEDWAHEGRWLRWSEEV